MFTSWSVIFLESKNNMLVSFFLNIEQKNLFDP